MTVDSERLNQFLGKFVGDLGAAFHAGMVVIGDQLGLYKALAAQPMTSAQLAERTGSDERYVRERLGSQAAGGYVSVSSWIPALDGVDGKLRAGAMVADIGCGHGASTILMAQAYPASRFVGFDYHADSIAAAREAAARAGVADRVRFEVAAAKTYPGEDFDFVCVFDCLHDMGDPVGAAAHVRRSLKPGGTWMIVEPFANDELQDNLNPVGRIYYSASTLLCTPCSRSQEVGLCLGAQAGEQRLGQVVAAGGFSRFRRATATPFTVRLRRPIRPSRWAGRRTEAGHRGRAGASPGS